MEILIFFCGIHSLAFALFHVSFWKLFQWKKDLKNITYVNRAIIQIANIRLIYFFLFTSVLCFVFPVDLVESRLGQFYLIGMSLFWMGRTIEQWIFFKNHHWINYTLTFSFILGAVLFVLPVLF